jgi:hypothetical protein
MELEIIRILRKITNIVIHRLPAKERFLNQEYLRVPAFLFTNDTDTLCINPDFAKWFKNNYIKDDEYLWAAIITHEELHKILIEFGNEDPDADIVYDRLDKIAPNVHKSMFFVDGDWNWLRSR